MKTILLTIEDSIYIELKQILLDIDEPGIQDEFIMLLMDAISKNKSTLNISKNY